MATVLGQAAAFDDAGDLLAEIEVEATVPTLADAFATVRDVLLSFEQQAAAFTVEPHEVFIVFDVVNDTAVVPLPPAAWLLAGAVAFLVTRARRR